MVTLRVKTLFLKLKDCLTATPANMHCCIFFFCRDLLKCMQKDTERSVSAETLPQTNKDIMQSAEEASQQLREPNPAGTLCDSLFSDVNTHTLSMFVTLCVCVCAAG